MAKYRVVWVIKEYRECDIDADSFEQAKEKWENGFGEEFTFEGTDDLWLIEDEKTGEQIIYNDIY